MVFKCEICSKDFNRKQSYDYHYMTHTGEKPFKCDICFKSFIQKGHYNQHLLTHSGEKPYQCEICTKAFIDKRDLAGHFLTHTGEKPFKCEVCLRAFAQRGTLARHSLSHTGEKPFQCEVCLKSFNRKATLLQHTLIHTGERPYSCEVCLKSFRYKGDRNKHVAAHFGERQYQCEICMKLFGHSSNLTRHMLTHTKGRRKKNSKNCQTSNDAVKQEPLEHDDHLSPEDIKRKLGFVEGQGQLIPEQLCEVKLEEMASGLENGIKEESKASIITVKKEPQEEDSNGLSDPSKASIKPKSASSSVEKNFKCDLCPRAFRYRSDFIRHEMTHTGQKPYACEICMKPCRDKVDLARHLSIHTGEKPFKCDLCPKSFRIKSILAAHQLVHAKINQCDLCQETLPTARKLNAHRRRVHRVHERGAAGSSAKERLPDGDEFAHSLFRFDEGSILKEEKDPENDRPTSQSSSDIVDPSEVNATLPEDHAMEDTSKEIEDTEDITNELSNASDPPEGDSMRASDPHSEEDLPQENLDSNR